MSLSKPTAGQKREYNFLLSLYDKWVIIEKLKKGVSMSSTCD